ncbi:MAG: hypothetical protein ACOY45_06605 [Pseudomonadota bacterium]
MFSFRPALAGLLLLAPLSAHAQNALSDRVADLEARVERLEAIVEGNGAVVPEPAHRLDSFRRMGRIDIAFGGCDREGGGIVTCEYTLINRGPREAFALMSTDSRMTMPDGTQINYDRGIWAGSTLFYSSGPIRQSLPSGVPVKLALRYTRPGPAPRIALLSLKLKIGAEPWGELQFRDVPLGR